MKLQLLNAVVMAEDYAALRDWYIDALDLELDAEWTENYHYAELKRDGRYVIGIADVKEMGLTPVPKVERKNQAVVAQLNVDDCRGFLARVKEKGGDVPFGPAYSDDEKFWYGAIADPEGNQCWVVEFPKLFQS